MKIPRVPSFIEYVIVLCLAILTYFFYSLVIDTEERYFTIPINVKIHPGFTISRALPRTVSVLLRGSRSVLARIGNDNISTFIDFSPYNEDGVYRESVQVQRLGIFQGIDNIEIEVTPAILESNIEKKITREVQVLPVFLNAPPSDYEFKGYSVYPNTVKASGPRSVVEDLVMVETQEINLAQETSNFASVVRTLYSGDALVEFEPEEVEVVTRIEKEITIWSVEDISIKVINLRTDFVLQDVLPLFTLVVRGPADGISQFEPTLTIDALFIEREGDYLVTPQLEEEGERGIELISLYPPEIMLRVQTVEEVVEPQLTTIDFPQSLPQGQQDETPQQQEIPQEQEEPPQQQELPQEQFEKPKMRIQDKYNQIEDELITEFRSAFHEMATERMREIAGILAHFKGYHRCVDAFIEESQANTYIYHDVYEDLMPLCKKVNGLVHQVFSSPESVMGKFVLNLYEVKLQEHVKAKLSNKEDDREHFLKNLHELYARTGRLTAALSDYRLGSDAHLLTRLTKHIFEKYLQGYIQCEELHLREKMSENLKSYYSMLGHQKKLIQQTGGLQDLQNKLRTKAPLNIGSSGPQVDFKGQTFLSQEIALNLLNESKQAFNRCQLLSNQSNLSTHAITIFDILTEYLCNEHIEYALEIGLQGIPSSEPKSYPQIYFFNVAGEANAIFHLLEKQFSDVLVPLIR